MSLRFCFSSRHSKRTLLWPVLLFFFAVSLCACSTLPPPRHSSNICAIFTQYPQWYWTMQKVQRRWGVPISVLMAIMKQESSFSAKAKPPRRKLFYIIPWFRPTSAFGYSQATDDSWRNYKSAVGKSSANRDEFADAADFIGWYANQAQNKLGISKRNPYKLYLAYHEGLNGYARRTYLSKPWLIALAKHVRKMAWEYHYQLTQCHANLPKKPWWHFWSD